MPSSTPPRPRGRGRAASVSVALGLLLLAACHRQDAARGSGSELENSPVSGGFMSHHVGVPLAQRPPLPVVVRHYEAMLSAIKQAVAAQVGTEGWSRRKASTPVALCADFGNEPDTGIRTLPFLIYHRFIPAPRWNRTAAIIAAVARRHGFADRVGVVDRPDEHRIDFTDRFGADLSVQDGPRLLSIGLITGCHLRGQPR